MGQMGRTGQGSSFSLFFHFRCDIHPNHTVHCRLQWLSLTRFPVLSVTLWVHCLFLTLHKISTLLAAFEKEFSLSLSSNLTGLINERGAGKRRRGLR